MSIVSSMTCDTSRRSAPAAAVTTRQAVRPTKQPGIRAYPLPASCRVASGHTGPDARWPVLEESGEYEIPDLLRDESYSPDRALFDAAEEHTEEQREAMSLPLDARNLLEVLMAAVENIGDSRAVQTEAVLKMALNRLRKAHLRIDRQDSRHWNLFLAYFELKAQREKESE